MAMLILCDFAGCEATRILAQSGRAIFEGGKDIPFGEEGEAESEIGLRKTRHFFQIHFATQSGHRVHNH